MALGRYDRLDGDAKEVVDLAIEAFDDEFDASDFGPFLTDFTDFDQDRVAGFLPLAIADVQTYVTMLTAAWTVDSYPYGFSVGKPALVIAMIIEIIRHLCRSYVEIPDTARVQAPDVVRRDYLTRWQSLLKDYQDQLKPMAKKLSTDLAAASFASGMNVRTLVDLPTSASVVAPWNQAERPQLGPYW